MAKANYRFEKRQRELKKQQRKQEKEKKKAEAKDVAGSVAPEPTSANIDSMPSDEGTQSENSLP